MYGKQHFQAKRACWKERKENGRNRSSSSYVLSKKQKTNRGRTNKLKTKPSIRHFFFHLLELMLPLMMVAAIIDSLLLFFFLWLKLNFIFLPQKGGANHFVSYILWLVYFWKKELKTHENHSQSSRFAWIIYKRMACSGMWNIVTTMNFSNHLIKFMWTTFSERIIYEVRWINFIFQINLNINYRDSCTSRILWTSSKRINWHFGLLFFSSQFAAKKLY